MQYFIDVQPAGAVPDRHLRGGPDARKTESYAWALADAAWAKAVLQCLKSRFSPAEMLLLAVPIRDLIGEDGPGADAQPFEIFKHFVGLASQGRLELANEPLSLEEGLTAEERAALQKDRLKTCKNLLWTLRRINHGAPPAESIPATPADTGGAPQDTGAAEGGASSPDVLILTGANSAASLASMPMRNLAMDEVDRWPEGNSRVAVADILKDGMRTRTRVTIPPKQGGSPVVYAVTADPDGTREITIYSGNESMSIELPAEWARAMAKELL